MLHCKLKIGNFATCSCNIISTTYGNQELVTNILIISFCLNFILLSFRLSTAPEKSSKFQWTFKLAHLQPEKRTYYFAAYSEKEMTVSKINVFYSSINIYIIFIDSLTYIVHTVDFSFVMCCWVQKGISVIASSTKHQHAV